MQVGRVGRPHGLDGAFVVERPSDDPSRFAVGARLLAGGEPATVTLSRRVGGGRVAISLDRPVERGTLLSVPRSELPVLPEGEYYVFELVGLDVVEEGGRPVGRVRDVLDGVANDNLELEDGRLLPLVDACVLDVDLPGRRIVIARGFVDGG